MTGAPSKWELMLSPKPCAICGANGFWVNRDGDGAQVKFPGVAH